MALESGGGTAFPTWKEPEAITWQEAGRDVSGQLMKFSKDILLLELQLSLNLKIKAKMTRPKIKMLLIFVIIYVTNKNNNTLIYPPSPKFIASHRHKNCTKTWQF